jgi:glutaminyl-tRNA synthetase
MSEQSLDKPSHFLRQIIERDLEQGTYAQQRFAGSPGGAVHHAQAPLDAARIRTRFPPEPNGYLHIGHAKSICINFGLATDYAGACHLRFDDTNPEKENQEYVDGIIEAVQWLGFSWQSFEQNNIYKASDYFDWMHDAALALIDAGLAYVDEQSAEDMRLNRGDFNTPGTESLFRNRTPSENRLRFNEMREGKHADGAMVLRAKIDMASPNINMRDPTIYRIKHAEHHHTGSKWCIYPMYTFAHPIEDALEKITHSICTLEFEDQRPFYDWLLGSLCKLGLLAAPSPQQYEFARLNVTNIVTSKRKLKQLVDENIVDGWDDPRMPTIVGLRRRGYTPQSLRVFVERTGVSKAGGWTEYASLESAVREDLEAKAPRAMAVLDPVLLELINWAEVFGSAAHLEPCQAPKHPHHAEWGVRNFTLGPELWIEQDDFAQVPPKGFHRLFVGNKVRLKYGVVIECTGCKLDAAGHVQSVQAKVIADTKSGTPGADAIKVKGVITWVGVHEAQAAQVRLYESLFNDEQPDAGGKDFKTVLSAESKKVLSAWLEPGCVPTEAEQHLQFERHGYFVSDRKDHRADAPVFNRVTSLKASAHKPVGSGSS